MPTSMLNLWNTSTVSHWHDPAWRNRYYYNMSHFPIAGDFIRWQDDMNYWNDYFKRPNTGGWADVKYPSKMAGAGDNVSGSLSRASVGFVSKNLTRLYDGKDTGRWIPSPEGRQRHYTYIGPVRGKFRYYGY